MLSNAVIWNVAGDYINILNMYIAFRNTGIVSGRIANDEVWKVGFKKHQETSSAIVVKKILIKK